jgi:antitoxin MazE
VRTRVEKWGDGLALPISKSFADEAGLRKDTIVDISVVGDKILVEPRPRRRRTLEELVAGITEENRHSEVDTGPSVGIEAW